MALKGKELLKAPGVKRGFIHDVAISVPRKIVDERGAVYHMLKDSDELFERFGEIYFSVVYPGAIKGWHLHEKMTLNYAVVSGMIKLVLYDDREGSPTRGNIMEVFMGDENYLLVKMPPNIWNGFKGIGTQKAIVANCTTLAHDPQEIKRADPMGTQVPYQWELKNE